MMRVMTITAANFDEAVLKSDKTVLLDFWATWCGPCRMLSPIVDEVAAERDDLVVGKVNVDEEMELAMKFGISSIPTLMVFKNGQCTNTSVGVIPKAQVLSLL